MGASGAMPRASALAPRANSTNYKTLYSFGAIPDGNNPHAGLIDMGGTLYGTTEYGGSHTCYYGSYSVYYTCGTVFSITTGGAERVLYSFGAPPDGYNPDTSLLDVGGTLYGTTENGGSYRCRYESNDSDCGTVFSVTTGGTENVLHSFAGPDGALPAAALLNVNGTLYGTTAGGGAHSCGSYLRFCGTVFSITKGGTEHVVYSFNHGHHANTPLGALIDADGTLYGTTSHGGAHSSGTVFTMTPGGGFKLLHSFGNTNGGPRGALVEVKGTFYGTTGSTVFSITPGGTEKLLHSFGKGDGRPGGYLIEVKGTLYGTTSDGGGSGCRSSSSSSGCGTVFSIATSGTEKVLHSFGYSKADGTKPAGGLIDVDGTLYGTTFAGGTNGHGTVFALTP